VTGLAILLLMTLLTAGVMRLAGLRGPALTMAGASLMLGAAGYAFQGSPGLFGSPRAGKPAPAPLPLTRVREIFFGRFYSTEHWLIMADSKAAQGKTGDAVGLIQSGIREHPRDYSLWVGLGNALVDHARGLTPAAELAYARAKQIAPTAPAPDYFLGLAKLRSGDLEGARKTWSELLARAPAQAQWRPVVADGVKLIDGMQAGAAGAPAQRP
jgi:cytochrome c-type biogenesis protein CcmH